MPIQFDKYDKQKVDNIKNHLDSYAAKGTPKYYEIFVDGLKAVNKTNDPTQFDNVDNYMTEDTKNIKIVIYGSDKSPRNEQYSFSMNARDAKEALDIGLDGFEQKSYTTKQLKEMGKDRAKNNQSEDELQALRKKVTELSAELEEKNEYVLKLEDLVGIAKANGNKIGGIHAGEVLAVFFENLVKRNKHRIANIPGLEGLSGLFDDEPQNASTQNQTDSEASFKKKDASPSGQALTDQEKQFLMLFHQIVKVFTPEEINQIIEMLEHLSRNKSQLKPVLELLQETKIK